MTETKDFESYFNDKTLKENQQETLIYICQLVHELYPDVQEKVVMNRPAFLPKLAEEDHQLLFGMNVKEEGTVIYGTEGLDAEAIAPFFKWGVTQTEESLLLPSDLSQDRIKKILQFIMRYNFERHGTDLIHTANDFSHYGRR
ncbi:MAG: hypothetical protein FWF14_03810 [Streptococcaceae bacterium]|nr:hypothetical protein [Streptococcaceae bacterium]